MSLKLHGNLTLEEWWLQWFGIHGRELGSNAKHSFGVHPKGWTESHRMFTNNPKIYLQFVNWCKENNKACWITSQPMREYNLPLGIEKIFFDFDYPLKKNWNMTPRRRELVKEQILEFLDMVDCAEPFIVATRKGYHVYIFLRRIYEFDPHNIDFAKDVFGVLGLTLLGMTKLYEQLDEKDRKRWKYLDFSPLGDICRMARVPLTIHEKTGLQCLVLNKRLKPTKIRSPDFYKTYGLGEDKISEAVKIVRAYYQKRIAREKRRIESGTSDFKNGSGRFQGRIRPCFQKRLEVGEMNHQQRLALLIEAYWSGRRTEEQLMDICRNFNDFNEMKSRQQVRWFLNRKAGQYPPYRCSTIQRLGWCLRGECPLYHKS